MKIIEKTKLSELLTKNWTAFINSSLLLKRVLEDASHIYNPPEVNDSEIRVSRQVQISISNFKFTTNGLEIEVEFSIPKEKGTLLGNHLYEIDHNDCLICKNSSGILVIQN